MEMRMYSVRAWATNTIESFSASTPSAENSLSHLRLRRDERADDSANSSRHVSMTTAMQLLLYFTFGQMYHVSPPDGAAPKTKRN